MLSAETTKSVAHLFVAQHMSTSLASMQLGSLVHIMQKAYVKNSHSERNH